MIIAHAGHQHYVANSEWLLTGVAVAMVVSIFGVIILAHADHKTKKPKSRKRRKK